MFQLPGVKYFMSKKLCQDPLVNFFGCQQQRGKSNENPTGFFLNTQALRVINMECQNVSGGYSKLKREFQSYRESIEFEFINKRTKHVHDEYCE